MELFDTAWVEKRNVLNELRTNNMTVQELRFFSIYLSKINHKDVSTRLVRFPIEDFQRIMGFGRLNMAQLRASTDSLLCKLVHIPDENGRGIRSFQLFKECHLFQDENGEWVVEIDAHDKALPLMFDFKTKYFKYELWNALRLKSPNQVRMYEILKQYEKLKRREVTVTELRELLGIAPNEYSDRTGWSNFKKKVLDSCQQALKETTDICYTYERGKVGKGGKWLSIVFHIKKNTEYIDQLTLDEFIAQQPDPDPLPLGTMGEDGEFVGQTTFFDAEAEDEPRYKNENLAFLAGACDEEFTEIEMEHIFTLIANKPMPEHQMGINFAREEYLTKMYSKLNVYAERKKLKQERRYAYFCSMLENDKSELGEGE